MPYASKFGVLLLLSVDVIYEVPKRAAANWIIIYIADEKQLRSRTQTVDLTSHTTTVLTLPQWVSLLWSKVDSNKALNDRENAWNILIS